MESMTGRAPTAKATLQPIKDSGVKGAATFTQKGDKVQLMADIGGLKPNQEHGFHIHEKGDCNSGDGMGAGGHFNPLGKPHAHPSMPERHAGDMFALKADDYGNATLSIELDVITVTEGRPASSAGASSCTRRPTTTTLNRQATPERESPAV